VTEEAQPGADPAPTQAVPDRLATDPAGEPGRELPGLAPVHQLIRPDTRAAARLLLEEAAWAGLRHDVLRDDGESPPVLARRLSAEERVLLAARQASTPHLPAPRPAGA
jgi:hypothetical protein